MAKKITTTLTLDKGLVKEAKKLGINMSGLMGLALKGFTFKTKGADEKTVRDSYDALFKAMLPLIEKYGANIKVAELDSHGVDEEAENEELEEHDEWYLMSIGDGKYMLAKDNEFAGPENFDDIMIQCLLPPDEILSNFIDGLTKSVKTNDEQVAKLQMAKRIVQAIEVPVTIPIAKKP